MKDLIVEYEHGLSMLTKMDRDLKAEQDLIMIKQLKEEHTFEDIERLAVIKSDRKLIRGMIKDMKGVIKWMKTGKRPGAKRGVENLAAYQREIAIDPDRFIYIAEPEVEVKTDHELKLLESQVEDLLWFLSKKEKDVYMLFGGYGFSVAKIADLTGMAEGTVSSLLNRARKKIRKNIEVDEYVS